MAYNRKNFLERVVRIQDIVLQMQREHPGITMISIYRLYVCEEYHISYSTFNNYMSIPAKRELEKYNNNEDYEK